MGRRAVVADALRLLREQARRTPPPQWVRSWRLDGVQFAERRMPLSTRSMPSARTLLSLSSPVRPGAAEPGGAAGRRLHQERLSPGGEISATNRAYANGASHRPAPNASILYATLAKGPKLPFDQPNDFPPVSHAGIEPAGPHQRHRCRRRLQNYPDDYQVSRKCTGAAR